MAEVQNSDVRGRPPGQPGSSEADSSIPQQHGSRGAGYSTMVEDGFSGWAWFTGGLFVLVGIFQMITGMVALAGPSYYTAPTRALVVDAGYTTWGWVHLILGIAMLVVGGGLAFGTTVARVAGVALAMLSAVVNLAFLPAAPFAGALIIALNVFLIYAITVHGGEPKMRRE